MAEPPVNGLKKNLSDASHLVKKWVALLKSYKASIFD